MRNLQERLDHRGVARIHRHSYIRGQADRAVARGDAVRILPGVVAATALARDPKTILRALLLWHRDAVIVGKTALLLLGMTAPGANRPMDFRTINEVEAFSSTRRLVRPGIRVRRWPSGSGFGLPPLRYRSSSSPFRENGSGSARPCDNVS